MARVAATMLLALSLLVSGMAQAKPDKGKRSPQGLVNINTATADQIQLLPGLGPSKAKAIIAYRLKRPFKASYELIRVRGIGRKTFRKLRSYLTVKGPTTLSTKVKLEDKKE
jgi:competence protein ComEA